jgi:hypothetical protein
MYIYSGFGQEKISGSSTNDKSMRHSADRETKLDAYKTLFQNLKESAILHSPGITKNNVKRISKFSATADVLTGWLYQTWNNPNWEDDSRYSAVLDETGYAVEEVWQEWNGSDWINTDKETETHDANGNWLEWAWYTWNGDWVGKEKQTQTYTNGNWTERMIYKWDNGWVDSLKYNATYDLRGNWIEILRYEFTGSGWQVYDRETQTYDQNDNWIEWFDYNLDGANWVYYERETIEYDANENWTKWNEYMWDEPDWDPSDQETQEYDTNGNWVKWIDYDWTIAGWEAADMYNAEYSGNNIVLWTGQYWDGSWINWWQENYIYDSNNNTELIYKEWNGSDWENVGRYLYTYSVTGISVLPGQVLTYNLSGNYPNPFNPSTLIQYQLPENGFVSLKIYDITGREVASLVNQEHVSGKYVVSFNAADLASGIYLYQLKVNNFNSTKKMMLLK